MTGVTGKAEREEGVRRKSVWKTRPPLRFCGFTLVFLRPCRVGFYFIFLLLEFMNNSANNNYDTTDNVRSNSPGSVCCFIVMSGHLLIAQL